MAISVASSTEFFVVKPSHRWSITPPAPPWGKPNSKSASVPWDGNMKNHPAALQSCSLHIVIVAYIYIHTLWLFNIAMGNNPFIDGLPVYLLKMGGFSMAMLKNQMVVDVVKSARTIE